MKLFVWLGLVQTVLATSVFGVDLYHLTFDSPAHVLGSPAAIGETDLPRTTPSSRNFGTSVIVPDFAGQDNPAMQFIPTNVPDSNFSYSQYDFSLSPFDPSPRYRVEFDLILSNFQTDGRPFTPGSGADCFTVLFDVPLVVRLDFTEQGFIREASGIVGTFQFDQTMHIVTEVDLLQNQWAISKDGLELYRGLFYHPVPFWAGPPSSIWAIRLNLADNTAVSGKPVATVDNFIIQVPEPTTGVLGVAGAIIMITWRRRASSLRLGSGFV